ncbi:hypothetical protein DNI29_20175 [Hymenobacter sediminis]|uniref:hypothetical protein n=1 Tax=Hymenobacter sediminis TaxID=2218621 RepID=UPI000F4E5BA9|nr:hypothetical protein [Hymenobacter sediminis]RPD45010.1 hypothetical protein DNI29_20175 [Hymenobacter sediminis]
MSLLLLAETPSLSLYEDAKNGWLYIDWQGHLTLPAIQESCLLISQYFLQRTYIKALNDNTNVLSMDSDVSPWLAKEFLPYTVLGGIQFIAWVYSPSISTQINTDIALFNLEAPVVALFSDTASACSWLMTARFPTSTPEIPQTHKMLQELQARPDIAPLMETLTNRFSGAATSVGQ